MREGEREEKDSLALTPHNRLTTNHLTASPSKTKKGKDIRVPTLLFILYLPRCKEPMATYFSNKLLALMP